MSNKIQKVGDVAKEAFSELNRLQKKEKLLIKTGEEIIDCHIGGLLAGDVVVISGLPSTGKSEKLYKMLDNMMSVEVNPKALNFVSCEFSFEMKMLNKLVRASHNRLKKSKTAILFEEFSDEEKEVVRNYYNSLQDDRRYVVQEPMTPEEFYKSVKEFCTQHKDKDAIIVSADHLLLFSGSQKQEVLERVSEYINLLKLEFNNIYFLLLSQLNRSALNVVKENSNDMIPNNSQLFGSSFMEQLASYIIIITNPFKLGINKYLKVQKDRYPYLSNFILEEKNNKVAFDTLGNLFFFLTKARESDNPWKDLFIEKMDLTEEQINKMKMDVQSEERTPQIELPVFNDYDKGRDIKPIIDLTQAFDV